MGKGFYVSKAVGLVAVVLCAGALATIIALSVVYSQEKTKSNQQVSPTDAGTTSKPPITPPPSNELWDKYRLPKVLKPDHYNVTLWPRLTLNATTGLYIFTGESSVAFTCTEETDLILIHSNKLNYTTLENNHLARLRSATSGVKAPSIKLSWLQTETQYLVLQLDGKLSKDHIYHLDTVFTGELADDLGGFYRSQYEEDGVIK
ncbi:Aminopeptidase N [Liparis tanakae]|uniref:Aminopeptidase N n=1 Tax=Liparis tanakae TaxID=230148 RepID=A0A4Z2EPE0_9TELE|nr:Aminopeptidase N [Liparis tanakae]